MMSDSVELVFMIILCNVSFTFSGTLYDALSFSVTKSSSVHQTTATLLRIRHSVHHYTTRRVRRLNRKTLPQKHKFASQRLTNKSPSPAGKLR